MESREELLKRYSEACKDFHKASNNLRDYLNKFEALESAEKQIETLQEENNRFKGLLKEAYETGYKDGNSIYCEPNFEEWLETKNIKL